MKLYTPMALLVGISLVVTQPMLRAQGGKREQEWAIAEIKELGGKASQVAPQTIRNQKSSAETTSPPP